MKTLLKVKDLCKTYIVNKQQNNVLRNVNMSIGEGDGTFRIREIHVALHCKRHGQAHSRRNIF